MTARSCLVWRSRRGIKEMDIIFQNFLNNTYDDLPVSDQRLFSELLGQADLDILNWLMGKTVPNTDQLKRIIAIIRHSGNI